MRVVCHNILSFLRIIYRYFLRLFEIMNAIQRKNILSTQKYMFACELTLANVNILKGNTANENTNSQTKIKRLKILLKSQNYLFLFKKSINISLKNPIKMTATMAD